MSAVPRNLMTAPPSACVAPSKKMQNVAPSIWVTINQSVAKYKPVNLGQGFPDFAPPRHVLQNLADISLDASNTLLHQYTRSMGHMRLVEILAKMYQPFHACQAPTTETGSTFLPTHALDPASNILISVGAYGSLFAAFSALVNPGDECIVMEPSFDCYGPMISQAGGTPVFVQLQPKDQNCSSSADWVLDMQQLEACITPRSRILVLNTPHNPLGKVFSRAELEKLAQFCVKHDLLCISDEVYEWIVFGEDEHIKIASLPGMWGRTVTIGSAGKTFSVTGWKLGWTIGPKELIQAMQLYQQNTIYTCPTPLQEAVARSLEHEWALYQAGDAGCYLRALRHELQEKSDRMVASLLKAGMRPMRPQSGYFLIADISQLPLPNAVEGSEGTLRDTQANEWLMQKHGICGIPQSVFYNSHETKKLGANFIRWCFAKQETTLEKAFHILENLK